MEIDSGSFFELLSYVLYSLVIIVVALIILFVFIAGVLTIWSNLLKPMIRPSRVKSSSSELASVIEKISQQVKILEQAHGIPRKESFNEDQVPRATSKLATISERLERVLSVVERSPEPNSVPNFQSTRKQSASTIKQSEIPPRRNQMKREVSPTAAEIDFHSAASAGEKSLDNSKQTCEPTDEVINLYNQAVTDSKLRERFFRLYPIVIFDTVNATERRRDPTLKPEFQTSPTNAGTYMAIQTISDREYIVVPNFDLAVKDSSYRAGAIGEVFDCPNYQPNFAYPQVTVKKAAFFFRDGENWSLNKPGALNLGQGENQ